MSFGRTLLGSMLVLSVSLSPGFTGKAGAQGVPCTEILSFSNRLEREAPSKSRDPIYIGRRLNVEAYWVETCLLTYGRRLKRHVALSPEAQEMYRDRWETGPHVAPAPEEKGVPEPKVQSRRKGKPRMKGETGWVGIDFRGRRESLTDEKRR